MNILILLLSAVINLILQITLFNNITLFGVVPNSALVLVVVISILKGRFVGSIFGVFIGLLTDILFSTTIGINALIYFLIGYFCGFAKDNFTRDNIFTPILFTGIATIFYNSMYAVIIYFLTANVNFSFAIRNILSFEIVYNIFLVIIYYKIFNKIFTRPKIKFN
ncbi:MAG: rod shape-determining protein MreD [Tissierellales bacterium]|nr:rod shape-determining protein MreD [Tissierellales bacterium]